MAEISAISWTDATFNPWIGCTKVSNGPLGACNNCYAERDNGRWHWVGGWGPGAPRRRTSEQNWNLPRRWDRKAASSGIRPKVFCASLADVFDNEVDPAWRTDLWKLLEETVNLRWMLLTKRIGNAPKMVPEAWMNGAWPAHVGIMSTIVTQDEWDRDYPKLAALPAPWHGVSDEPTLAPIDIGMARPDWIITGGESGEEHRPLDMSIVRSMRDQCRRNGIEFHHKQNGGVRGKDSGCLVDGVEHKNFPLALR